RRVWNKALTDVEAGALVEETEGNGAAGAGQIVEGVAHDPDEECAESDEHHDLEEDAAHNRVVEKGHPVGVARLQRLVSRHGYPLLSRARDTRSRVPRKFRSAGQRIGGAYCRPPLLHR